MDEYYKTMGGIHRLTVFLNSSNLSLEKKRYAYESLLSCCRTVVSGSRIMSVEEQAVVILLLKFAPQHAHLASNTISQLVKFVEFLPKDLNRSHEYFLSDFGKVLIVGLLRCDGTFQLGMPKIVEDLLAALNSIMDLTNIHICNNVLEQVFNAITECSDYVWGNPLTLLRHIRFATRLVNTL